MQQPSYVTPTELADVINELKAFMTSKLATKDEVRQLRTEVGELRTEVGQLKTEVGEIRTEVGQLKTEVGEIRTEVGQLRETVVTGFLEIKKHMEEWPNTPHPRSQ